MGLYDVAFELWVDYINIKNSFFSYLEARS